MTTIASDQFAIQKSRRRGYAAFIVCAGCVGLNVLAYLPSQTFEEAEAAEFTVTLLLILLFVAAALAATISTIKNRRDVGLTCLLLLTVAFVAISYITSWEWRGRVALQISYAILVLVIGAIRLVELRHRAT